MGGLLKGEVTIDFIPRENTSITERRDMLSEVLKEGYTRLISENSIVVNGYSGKKIIYVSEVEGGGYCVEYWIQKDRILYEFLMATSLPSNENFVHTFDRIITTLVFK